jgi:hypothetical protein
MNYHPMEIEFLNEINREMFNFNLCSSEIKLDVHNLA